MAMAAVMETGGSFHDVYGLFTDSAARARIVGRLKKSHVQTFWREDFPKLSPSRRAAVTTKLAPIVFHPVLGPILCARGNLLDADRAISKRSIVLVNLAYGTPAEHVTTILGTFLVQKIVAAAFRQGRLTAHRRQRHVLIIDEFQRFMHKAAGFDQILSEARKYGLHLIVANQFVEQLAPEVRAALFGNVGCLAAFRVGPRDARILAQEFRGAEPDELLELGRGQCMVRMGNEWTMAYTHGPPSQPSDDPTERIIQTTRERCRRKSITHRETDSTSLDAAETDKADFDEGFELVG
jgi:hypothetical protein